MTWYTYRNYGTALQASALYHTIRELGYDPDMIRYLPRGYREELKMTDFRFWLDKIKNKLSVWNNRPYHSQERDMLFRDYLLDHITETQYCASLPELKELNEIYDAFVCGSDQIWSLQGFEDPYFQKFLLKRNGQPRMSMETRFRMYIGVSAVGTLVLLALYLAAKLFC